MQIEKRKEREMDQATDLRRRDQAFHSKLRWVKWPEAEKEKKEERGRKLLIRYTFLFLYFEIREVGI